MLEFSVGQSGGELQSRAKQGFPRAREATVGVRGVLVGAVFSFRQCIHHAQGILKGNLVLP
jgi:hypothetical protein